MRVLVARSFLQRARGLLGRTHLAADEALLLRPCSSVHTFGMCFAIDVVFIDPQGVVVAVREALGPWRFARCRGAAAVLEMAAGRPSARPCSGWRPAPRDGRDSSPARISGWLPPCRW